METKQAVFVYGTLLDGQSNHGFLNGAIKIGSFRTVNQYRMTASRIPFVSDRFRTSTIVGELYAVDDATLERLDRLEGHPRFYTRRETDIQSDDGEHRFKAWMYFCETQGADLIDDGDFATYIEKGGSR